MTGIRRIGRIGGAGHATCKRLSYTGEGEVKDYRYGHYEDAFR
jgi:hypothetical protein